MKIKMTSCVVSQNGLAYNHSCEFTVGENIEKEFAMNLVKANLAVAIEDEVEVKVEELKVKKPKVEKPKVEKQKVKRGKTNEV